MNLYHIWCDLEPGVSDTAFADNVHGYLGRLRDTGALNSYRITRRKLGLGPREIGEFHIMVEFEDLRQLETAFESVAARRDPVEELHHAVNQWATNVQFALYRDFPDDFRHRGEERF